MLFEISKRENYRGHGQHPLVIEQTVWAKVEDSMGDVSGGVRRRLNQISAVLEALSFRHIDAHHACISEKQTSKRDLALAMPLAESLMYS